LENLDAAQAEVQTLRDAPVPETRIELPEDVLALCGLPEPEASAAQLLECLQNLPAANGVAAEN